MGSTWRRSGLVYIIILLAGVALATFLFSSPQKTPEIPLSQVVTLYGENKIQHIVVDGQWLNITQTDGTKVRSFKGDIGLFDIAGIDLNNVRYEVQPTGIDWGSMLITLLPFVIFGGLLFFLLFRVRGANNQAMSFGRSRARLSAPAKPNVTFDDVAGEDEAKQELREV